MLAERKRERFYLEEDFTDHAWIGAITDGEIWYLYEWSVNIKDLSYKPIKNWEGRRLDKNNIKELLNMFERKIGLDWTPSDPTNLFIDHLESLKVLYEQEDGNQSLETMKELWLRQLKASGNAPENKHDETELFILHTLLISISVLIANSIINKDEPSLGFAAWVFNSDWLEAVKSTINNYNWRQGNGDVLRVLYMGLVDSKHRKIYGEFYTPDWLAELLCLEVLDDKWIQKCINDHFMRKHSGVLDPACGSGTFLYHAAKRIAESKEVEKMNMDPKTLSNMLVQLVNGIDIHPVAVEMAKTNLLRALPAIPNSRLRIWQGDSLQTKRRVITTLFDEDIKSLKIYSRENEEIILPKSFLSRKTINNDIEKIVKCANQKDKNGKHNKPFPLNLYTNLGESDFRILHKTYETLQNICQKEGNSIWAWYIVNHIGPYLLANQKVSRIVANPPWVRISNIQDESRKKEIIDTANEEKVWVGGKNATTFDIASLFVTKCTSLYLHESDKSGWVLPQGALKGSNWNKYIKTMKFKIIKRWDLGSLPFPKQSKSCVHIVGKTKNQTSKLECLEKQKGDKILHDDSWDMIKENLNWNSTMKEFPIQKSRWATDKEVSIRQGATLVPNCLIRIAEKQDMDDGTEITTVPSRHKPWKPLGTKTGIIPNHWICNVITANELLPYRITNPCQFIIPLDKTKTIFDKNRMNNEYWRNAEGIYKKHMSKGASSPRSLLERINYQRGLENQIGRKNKHFVIYNKSGTRICASRADSNTIVGISAYGVSMKTKEEVLFLTALLNADCLQNAYLGSQKTDRHFATHFWSVIPIPRYDAKNEFHKKLAKLASKAEKVSADCPEQNRKAVRDFLHNDGVAKDIDDVVKKILPKYVTYEKHCQIIFC